jgi:hypothetical protein
MRYDVYRAVNNLQRHLIVPRGASIPQKLRNTKWLSWGSLSSLAPIREREIDSQGYSDYAAPSADPPDARVKQVASRVPEP